MKMQTKHYGLITQLVLNYFLLKRGRKIGENKKLSEILRVSVIIMLSLFLCIPLKSTNIKRISANPSTGEADGNSVERPYLSSDGRYIAFSSEADDLVPNDTNGCADVFVYDRNTGTLERVSLANDGTQGNDWSRSPSISGDGRYVVFNSAASNLVAGDTNNAWDTFVYDRTTHIIQRISVAADGTQGNQGTSVNATGHIIKNLDDVQLYTPSISADGRYIAFSSDASNLVPGDTNEKFDIFVKDRISGAIQRVSVSSTATEANGASFNASISANGRYVVFNSAASNLVAGDTNNVWDTFVYDRITSTVERVSVASDGTQANGQSVCVPFITSDGRYVTFTSFASNLVANDTNNTWDVFVYDRTTHSISRVSVAYNGEQANAASYNSSISDDGRYVTFASEAQNLVPFTVSGTANIYVRDLQENKTWCAVLLNNASTPNGVTNIPTISADGSYIAFNSDADNIVSNDTAKTFDIFVTRSNTPTARISFSVSPLGGGTTSPSGDTDVDIGFPITIKATASQNYHFLKWTAGNSNVTIDDVNSATTQLTATGDASVTAEFAHDTVTLTMALSNSESGSVSPTTGTHTVNTNEPISIEATASPNYHFTCWTASEGSSITDATSASTTVTLTSDATITANFEHDTAVLTMQIQDNTGGSVSPSEGTHTVNIGEAINIIATPASDYEFLSWEVSGDGKITNPSSPLTAVVLTGNATVTAKFIHKKVTVVFSVSPEGAGTTDPQPVWKHSINLNKPITIKAQETEGYHFTNWTISGNGTLGEATSPETTLTPASDCTVTANFAQNDTALVLTYPNGGESFVRGTTITIRWASSNSNIKNVKLEVLNDSDTDTTITDSTENDGSYEWTIPEDITPGKFYKVKISGTPDTGDLVSDTSNNYFSITTDVYLTIISPNGGEKLIRGSTTTITWASSKVSGNVKLTLYKNTSQSLIITSSTDNDGSYEWTIPEYMEPGDDYKIVITSLNDASISDSSNAAFVISTGSDAVLTISTIPTGSGTVSPDTGSHTVNTGETISISASPASGYQFLKWIITGNGKIADSSASNTSLVVSGDTSVTAIFAADKSDFTVKRVSIAFSSDKDNSGKLIIKDASLPNIITSEDIEKAKSFTLLIDNYRITINKSDNNSTNSVTSKKYYQVKQKDETGRIGINFRNLKSDENRVWNVTGTSLYLGDAISYADGIDIYLITDAKIIHSHIDVQASEIWNFKDGTRMPIIVQGTPITNFDISEAKGRIITDKKRRDMLKISEAVIYPITDFSPINYAVTLTIDNWSKTLNSDDARQISTDVWLYKGRTFEGGKYSFYLNFIKNRWRFRIGKLSFNSRINPEDGIDITLRIGDYQSGLKLNVRRNTLLSYEKKKE